MDYNYNNSEWYEEYRRKMASEFQDAQADQEWIMSWLGKISNRVGSQLIRWGERLQPTPNEMEPQL